MMMINTNGRHLLVEYWDCDSDVLDDPSVIESLMREAAIAAGATIVGTVFHQFSPCGVSGVVVVQESHLSVHTWPEAGYAAVDFYTCGDCVPETAHRLLREGFGSRRFELVVVERGLARPPRSIRVRDVVAVTPPESAVALAVQEMPA